MLVQCIFSHTVELSNSHRFINEMAIKPDGVIWGALPCGCSIYHEVKLPENVAKKFLNWSQKIRGIMCFWQIYM